MLLSHKGLAVAGAGGVAALALINRKKAAASGAATQPGSAYGAYDSTSSDLFNSLEPILQGLGNQQDALGQALANLSQPASGPKSVVPGGLPPQVYSGAGFGPFTPSQLSQALAGQPVSGSVPKVTGADGGTYIWVTNPAAADAAAMGGATLYAQPAPGVFVSAPWQPGKGAGLAGGTPIFLRQPGS